LRTLFGGPAPSSARRELRKFVERLDDDAKWVQRLQAELAWADQTLESSIDAIIGK
jgi:hypothetical protein